MKSFFTEHYLALIFAVVVGVIFLAPSVFFIFSLGDAYQGIPMMATANEDSYLARIQEILDGNPMLGSPFFYEYKEEWPITPPTGELLYAISSLLFDVSPANIILASRPVLISALFLLVYYLIYQLTVGAEISRKINAVAGALLVILGYDLVDYRSIIASITQGHALAGNFLLWARPVNPILGAIFLMSFLLFIWQIVQKKNNKKTIAGASLFLALMIMSYFFSWGMALSVLAVLILIYLLKRDYGIIINFLKVMFFAIVLTLPYWYIIFQASKSPWYKESVLRSGLFVTHYPLLNKLTIVVLVFYLIIFSIQVIKEKALFCDQTRSLCRRIIFYLKDWHIFSLAFVLGPLWAYNQQIITGQTVWPYHFVQYSIPLAMIVVMVLFYNIIKNWSPCAWRIWASVVVSISLVFGVSVQVSAYKGSYEYYSRLQSVAPLLDWLKDQKEDCVVMVKETDTSGHSLNFSLNFLIPAFTRCDTYSSNALFSIMPDERQYHNYLANLALDEIPIYDIEKFVSNHTASARDYLYSNWKGAYGVEDFPDFEDDKLWNRIDVIPEEYKKFIDEGLRDKLKKYRLDYIVSGVALSQNMVDKLSLELVFKTDNLFLYHLKG